MVKKESILALVGTILIVVIGIFFYLFVAQRGTHSLTLKNIGTQQITNLSIEAYGEHVTVTNLPVDAQVQWAIKNQCDESYDIEYYYGTTQVTENVGYIGCMISHKETYHLDGNGAKYQSPSGGE